MLGIVINTFNDVRYLSRALRDLFRCYKGEYVLFVDDDGSNPEEFRRLEILMDQYGGRIRRPPQRKGRLTPYMVVREMELFHELATMNARLILKLDPDTCVCGSEAFQGPEDADLCGMRKRTERGRLLNAEVSALFAKHGSPLDDIEDYCQGGFYFLNPELVVKIARSPIWKEFVEIHSGLKELVPEDRMLCALCHASGGSVRFWNKGFFHGYAKFPLEYYTKRLHVRHPSAYMLWRMATKLRPVCNALRISW